MLLRQPEKIKLSSSHTQHNQFQSIKNNYEEQKFQNIFKENIG